MFAGSVNILTMLIIVWCPDGYYPWSCQAMPPFRQINLDTSGTPRPIPMHSKALLAPPVLFKSVPQKNHQTAWLWMLILVLCKVSVKHCDEVQPLVMGFSSYQLISLKNFTISRSWTKCLVLKRIHLNKCSTTTSVNYSVIHWTEWVAVSAFEEIFLGIFLSRQ